LACNIKNKLDVDACSFAHLTLTLFLHDLVKCRSHILAVYNNECILVAHASALYITARPQDHWKSAVTQLTTSCGRCGVCFTSESVDSRFWTLTNWNDTSTANGPLCVTRSLNMLSASGISVYALASYWRRTL